MTVHYSWYDNAETIALCEISGRWTWDEFYDARSVFRQVNAAVERPRVDILLYLTPEATMPDNFITVMRSVVSSAAKSWGITVLVRPQPFVRALFNVLRKTYPDVGARYPFAESFEQAVMLVMESRGDVART